MKKIDFAVGLLLIIAALALMFTAIQVSGLSPKRLGVQDYSLTARFSNIGDLKIRAAVRLAGVTIGQVDAIVLDPKTFEAVVTLGIDQKINDLPVDTSATIAQSGLLGDNYISLSPGFSSQNLKNGDKIFTTYSATSLSSLLATFVNGSGSGSTSASNSGGSKK